MQINEWEKHVKYVEKIDKNDYTGYFNGYPLLLQNDANKNTPEIFIYTSNRTAGKTFFVKSFVTLYSQSFFKKFLWLVRKQTQLLPAMKSFIEDVQKSDNFDGEFKINKSEAVGVKELLYEGVIIGYFTYLNWAENLKEASNMFNGVDIIVKDEYQSLTGDYCKSELDKLKSIHQSVARGYKQHVRFVPTILCGNHISIVNPYFIGLGLHKIFNQNQKKYKGDGWVCEMTWNKQAAEAALSSPFERAFKDSAYSRSSNANISFDNMAKILKTDTSKCRYICTLIAKDSKYGLWLDSNKMLYISKIYQKDFKKAYAINQDCLEEGAKVLSPLVDDLLYKIKQYFNMGRLYFENIECKAVCAEIFYFNVLTY